MIDLNKVYEADGKIWGIRPFSNPLDVLKSYSRRHHLELEIKEITGLIKKEIRFTVVGNYLNVNSFQINIRNYVKRNG